LVIYHTIKIIIFLKKKPLGVSEDHGKHVPQHFKKD